jgi:hypothetical protein
VDVGEDDRLAPHSGGGVPDSREGQTSDAEDLTSARSLLEDIETIVEDGKTYFEAEVHYQKSRALFVADQAKSIAVFGAIAAALGFIALIGLTLGLILALSPWLTTWGASAVVVGAEFFCALLLVRMAATRWNRVMAVFASGPPKDDG